MSYDLILVNGRVVDGAGNPWFRADVGIKAGKIARLGQLKNEKATATIDVEGLIVCPGFIDIHDHSDIILFKNPKADAKIMQGITTLLGGNCGLGVAPLTDISRKWLESWKGELLAGGAAGDVKVDWTSFGDYLRKLEMTPTAVNFACLVGHGIVRASVMGLEDRAPTRDELENMKALVAQAMQDGAFGLSTGLVYEPAFFADKNELIELARVAADYDGFFAIHIRGHCGREPKAVREAIEISRNANIPLQISHIETHFAGGWGNEVELLRLVDEARGSGLDVACDIHPGHEKVAFPMTWAMLPHWAIEGGLPSIVKRLENKSTRKEIRDYILAKDRAIIDDSEGKFGIATFFAHQALVMPEIVHIKEFDWKTLKEFAEERGKDPYETALDLILEAGESGKELTQMSFSHDEEDVRLVVQHPTASFETDEVAVGHAENLLKKYADPRTYGMYPLVYRKYVLGKNRIDMPDEDGKRLITMEEFVRKSTSLPAQRMGLRDRGMVRENMWADIVVFNPETLSDAGTYKDPHKYPTGIEFVLVNGTVVVKEGVQTQERPGKILRGGRYSSGKQQTDRPRS